MAVDSPRESQEADKLQAHPWVTQTERVKRRPDR